jgi:DNA-binding CsgD family transcriptional regulator
MTRDGLDAGQAARQIWIVDLPGLLADDMAEGMLDYQRPYARPAAEAAGWTKTPVQVDPSTVQRWPQMAALRKARATSGIITLQTVIEHVKPTILIGSSTAHGAFEVALAALRAAGRLPGGLFIAAHPLTTEVRAFLLHALAGLGETAQADAVLTETAESELFPFPLHPVPELVERQARQRTSHPGHPALIRKIISVHGGRAPAAGPPERLPEPISQAEARVLRLLQTSLSAPEIARELYVSVNTVRTHMRHLYDKLGAHRRLEALDRARALGLLGPIPQRALTLISAGRI